MSRAELAGFHAALPVTLSEMERPDVLRSGPSGRSARELRGGCVGQRPQRSERHYTAGLHVAPWRGSGRRRRRREHLWDARQGCAAGRRPRDRRERQGRLTASIGIRGQGNGLKRGFAKLKNVEIKTLCDIDENLFASRANDAALLKDVPTFKPGFVQDLRRVLDDKDIDAVIIATPNHWHALATIWALQAGKHVYVEKPASHTVSKAA